MQIEIKHGPSGTAALCHFSPGDTMTAESGSFMAMTPNITMTTSTRSRGKGGLLAGVKRLLSGESFFLNHFSAKGEGAVWMSTPLPGDIVAREMKGEGLILAGGAYIASGDGVGIDLQFQGFRGLFTGESLFWIRAQGTGPLLMGSFGHIYPVPVDGKYIVDSGHIVAFDETLNFKISKAGGSWVHSFLGGEGLVCNFEGRGTVWCQSHNPGSFGQELTSYLRAKKG